jgi:hypothetical protein
MFVVGDTKGMRASDAEKAGLTRGSFVEMALCAIDLKTLTFEPNYINEEFLEIWGIPTGGEMKTKFHEKCSELSTFLIHRQSKDRMGYAIEQLSREAFNSWVSEGMSGDVNQYMADKGAQLRTSSIYRFEMTAKEGQFGSYFIVSVSSRSPQNDFECAALNAAKQIYSMAGVCTDPRIEENHQRSLGLINLPALPEAEPAILPNSSKSKGRS